MNRTELSNFKRVSFLHGRSRLLRFFWIMVSLVLFETSIPFPNIFKVVILRLFGSKVGKGLIIKTNVKIKHPWRLEIGDNCWIGENVWIDNLVLVKLESNVCLSQGVYLLTGNHNYKSSSFDLMTGEIHLGDGVWIGAKSIVGPGVNCSSHSVLAAGSTTFHNLEAYGIYQGNTAVFKRKRIIV